MKRKFDDILSELCEHQKGLLLDFGRKIIPTLTSDDVLQPNDYPELENHPQFRYEEGVLAGLQSAQIAFLASKKEQESVDDLRY